MVIVFIVLIFCLWYVYIVGDNVRYAVLGDIHGNYYALEAVLEDIKNEYGNKIDGYILTGDYMGEFPDGSKVVDTLKKLTEANPGKVHIIKGNRETGQVEPYLE